VATGPLAGSAEGLIWLITRKALAQVASDPAARAVLEAGRVLEIIRPGQAPVPGIGATCVQTFHSYGELHAALAGDELAAGVEAVLYDCESWQFTPLVEQQRVGYYTDQAAALARASGQRLIAAPAVSLVKVLAPGTGDRYDRFIEAGIARSAAAADIVDIQAQNAERDPVRYARFVGAAAAQVRVANPSAVVIAGLSTNPPGAPVYAEMLTDAICSVSGLVQGFWLNVPDPGPHCPTCNPAAPQVGIAALIGAFC
jgi:hypothetical protein